MTDKQQVRITGKVVSRRTGRSIGHARIAVYRNVSHGVTPRLFGRATADACGMFGATIAGAGSRVSAKPIWLTFRVAVDDRSLGEFGPMAWTPNADELALVEVADPKPDLHVIPEEHLAILWEAATRLTHACGKQRAAAFAHLRNLASPAALLDAIAVDGRRLLHGDRTAAAELAVNLSRLPRLDAAAVKSILQVYGEPPTEPLVVIRKEPVMERATHAFARSDLPGGIPRIPRFPGLPCLAAPDRMMPIYFGIGLSTRDVKPYLASVHAQLDRLMPLESLYGAARRVIAGAPDALAHFERVLGSTSLPAGDGWPFPPEPPFPTPPMPGIQLPCRVPFGGESDAARCLRALFEGPRFRVTDIRDTVLGTSRAACVGNEVEITGSALGTRGTIDVGGVPVTEIRSWTETSIRFVVPDRAIDGPVGLCIDPELADCSAMVGMACRLPDASVDLGLEVHRPATITEFRLEGASAETSGDDAYDIESCQPFVLVVTATFAQQVIITDGAETIWQSEDVESARPRTISERVPVDGIRTMTTYRASASSLCRTHTAELHVTPHERLHLHVVTDPVIAGEQASVRVSASCPSPPGGREVTITSSNPALVVPPSEPVVIPDGERSTIVLFHTHLPCGDVTITATAPGQETATTPMRVHGPGHISSLSPLTTVQCEPVTLRVRGTCFSPPPWGHTIELTRSGELAAYGYSGLVPDDPGDPLGPATLEFVATNLGPGDYRVRIRSYMVGQSTLLSEYFDGLRVTAAGPEIFELSGSSPFGGPSSDTLYILPCIPTAITVRMRGHGWESFELLFNGTREDHARWTSPCLTIDRTDIINASEPGTIVLAATGSNGEVSRANITLLDHPDVIVASAVTLVNDTDTPGFTDMRLRVWVGDAMTGRWRDHGDVEPGDDVEVELRDHVYQVVIALSYEWIAEWNDAQSLDDPDSVRTPYTADDPYRIWREARNLIPLTLWVCGRDEAGEITISVAPGDAVGSILARWGVEN